MTAAPATPAFDHIAFTVPDLDEQVERLTTSFGLVARSRNEHFAVLEDPGSGCKFELSRSPDAEVHLRHLGFRADDVDATHAELVADGMAVNRPPQRQDFAAMYTSYLQEAGSVEVQLVKYDVG